MMLKICGMTRLEDALHAAANGATAIGFVFWPKSPRYIPPDAAAAIVRELPAHVAPVGVFVNESADVLAATVARVALRLVQLHGDERAEDMTMLPVPLVRSLTLAGTAGLDAWPPGTTFLLDAADPERRGGTGVQVDWVRAAQLAAVRPIVLAGGLTPENVAAAIAAVRPAGVDVSSGVEVAPGIKDPMKVAAFLTRARTAFQTIGHAGAVDPGHPEAGRGFGPGRIRL